MRRLRAVAEVHPRNFFVDALGAYVPPEVEKQRVRSYYSRIQSSPEIVLSEDFWKSLEDEYTREAEQHYLNPTYQDYDLSGNVRTVNKRIEDGKLYIAGKLGLAYELFRKEFKVVSSVPFSTLYVEGKDEAEHSIPHELTSILRGRHNVIYLDDGCDEVAHEFTLISAQPRENYWIENKITPTLKDDDSLIICGKAHVIIDDPRRQFVIGPEPHLIRRLREFGISVEIILDCDEVYQQFLLRFRQEHPDFKLHL